MPDPTPARPDALAVLRRLLDDPSSRAELLAAFEGGYEYGVAETQGFTWGRLEDEFAEYLQRRAARLDTPKETP